MAFTPGDNVLFDNLGISASSVNLSNALNPNAVVVDSDYDYTFTTSSGGTLANKMSLIKRGVGRLTIDVDNLYTGSTTIEGGVLQVGVGGARGSLGGGTLTNNSGLVVNRTGTLVIGGDMHGSSGLTNIAAGAVPLSGNNTADGPVAVDTGAIILSGAQARGNLTNFILNASTSPYSKLGIGGGITMGPEATVVCRGTSLSANRRCIIEATSAASHARRPGMKFFTTALFKGIIGFVLGMAAGLGLVTGIRALMGLPLLFNNLPHEGGFVLGGVFAVIGFLLTAGVLNDWLKWAAGESTPDHHEDPAGWVKYLGVSLDHKVIGIQYGFTSLFLFITAGTFALLFRTELAGSGMQFLTQAYFKTMTGIEGTQLYNTLISLHGIVMIGAILLGVGAMSNYLVPLIVGARDMAFPRLNAFSYWKSLILPSITLALFLWRPE